MREKGGDLAEVCGRPGKQTQITGIQGISAILSLVNGRWTDCSGELSELLKKI